MIALPIRWLGDATLRAAPGHQLFRTARLARGTREVLSRLRARPDYGGVLRRHAPGGMELIALTTAGRRLWSRLRRPAPLRTVLHGAIQPAANQAAAVMILDGILEIEFGGRFVTGIESFPAVFVGQPSHQVPHRLGRLAVQALSETASLGHQLASVLAAFLYGYNSLPASLSRRNCYYDLDESDIARRGGWRMYPVRAGQAWTYWVQPATERAIGEARYKLYLSPACDHIRGALRAALSVPALREATVLKLGRGLGGLLRPDKLVAYFPSNDALHRAAVELRGELDKLPAHGVPFSQALDDDGLLSCAVDPPAIDGRLEERESWRQWTARQLGSSLATAARSRDRPVEVWQYAVSRLGLSGVPPTALSLEVLSDAPPPSVPS